MEQAHTGERHRDAVLVRGLDHVVIADGAARLYDVLNAGLACALYVVAKREERIRADGNAGVLRDPRLFLLCGEHLRLYLEGLLPYALCEDILVLIRGVNVDGVVAVRAADAVNELKAEHLRMLTHEPVVRLAAREARAVDAALLTCADADGHAVLDVADRVGLGVLKRDKREDHVVLRALRQILVLGNDVVQQALADLVVVVALLEADAENVALLDRLRLVVRVDLDHVIAALALGFQDFERFCGEIRGDDAVGDLVRKIGCGVRVAGVGQRRPVAVGAQAIRAACADVGAGNGRQLFVGIDKVHLLLNIGQRLSERCAGRRNVLEGGCCRHAGRLLERADELPRVESVAEVDITRLAVENLNGELALGHEDAGRLLVRVAAVL